jgi:hypothetical protein
MALKKMPLQTILNLCMALGFLVSLHLPGLLIQTDCSRLTGTPRPSSRLPRSAWVYTFLYDALLLLWFMTQPLSGRAH